MNFIYINDTNMIIPLLHIPFNDLLKNIQTIDIIILGICIILLIIINYLRKLTQYIKKLEDKYELEYKKNKEAIKKIEIILKEYEKDNLEKFKIYNNIFKELNIQIKLITSKL